MNFIRYIFIGLVIIPFIVLSFSICSTYNSTQNKILSYFITIDVTVIGFIITLIGILAAIRNINLVDSYMRDHGNNFKIVLFLNVFSGILTIILVLLWMILYGEWMGAEYLLIVILVLQGLFLTSCMFIIINMIDMIFKEPEKPIEQTNIYKKL